MNMELTVHVAFGVYIYLHVAQPPDTKYSATNMRLVIEGVVLLCTCNIVYHWRYVSIHLRQWEVKTYYMGDYTLDVL